MKLVRLADASSHVAPKHFDVAGYRLQSADPHSALEGEIAVTLGSSKKSVLRKFDSRLLAAYERREVHNNTQAEAIILVITPPPADPASAAPSA